MRVMPRIGFFERLKHLLSAIGEHKVLLLMAAFFSLMGLMPVVLYENEAPEQSNYIWALVSCIVFQIGVIAILYTVATSTIYYYEKSLSKKYGINILGTVTRKRAEDHSYTDGTSNREIEEIHYIIEFSYQYSGAHESEFYVDSQVCYERIKVGDEVPIRVLSFKPEVVFPRVRKLAAAYGLKQSQCA